MLKITYVLGTLALHSSSLQLRNHDFTIPRFNSLLWKALVQVHGPKGMELCS